MKWAEYGRVTLLQQVINNREWLPQSNVGFTLFVRWQQFTFADQFILMNQHMMEDRKKIFEVINKPLNAHAYISHIGNTSLKIETNYTTSTGDRLMHNVAQIVCVDTVTKRPQSFSDKLKSLLKPILDKKTKTNTDKYYCEMMYNMPNNTVTYHYTAMAPFSGIDSNGHLNQAYYVTFCLDALHAALQSNTFPGVPNDLKMLKIKRFSFLYLKECLIGDLVDITVWQNSNDRLYFHFHFKVNGALIHQCEILFVKNLNSHM